MNLEMQNRLNSLLNNNAMLSQYSNPYYSQQYYPQVPTYTQILPSQYQNTYYPNSYGTNYNNGYIYGNIPNNYINPYVTSYPTSSGPIYVNLQGQYYQTNPNIYNPYSQINGMSYNTPSYQTVSQTPTISSNLNNNPNIYYSYKY